MGAGGSSSRGRLEGSDVERTSIGGASRWTGGSGLRVRLEGSDVERTSIGGASRWVGGDGCGCGLADGVFVRVVGALVCSKEAEGFPRLLARFLSSSSFSFQCARAFGWGYFTLMSERWVRIEDESVLTVGTRQYLLQPLQSTLTSVPDMLV